MKRRFTATVAKAGSVNKRRSGIDTNHFRCHQSLNNIDRINYVESHYIALHHQSLNNIDRLNYTGRLKYIGSLNNIDRINYVESHYIALHHQSLNNIYRLNYTGRLKYIIFGVTKA